MQGHGSCCKVSGVVVGEGFRFGYKAAGNTKVLQELGQAHGLDVSVVSLVASGCSKGPEMVGPSPLLLNHISSEPLYGTQCA